MSTPLNFLQASVRADELVANQKMGIGVSGQSSELHIKASAPEIRLEDKVGAEASETATRIYADSGNTYIQSGVDFADGSSSNIVFGSMGNETEFVNIGAHGIETTGNLFVNNLQFTQTQGLDQILNVSNTTSNIMTLTNTSDDALNVAGGMTLGSNLAVNTDDLFVDTQTGNVGIGETSPQTPLHIRREIGNAGPDGTFNGTITETEYMRFMGVGLTSEVNSVSIGLKIAGDYLGVGAQYSGRLNIYANDYPDAGNAYGGIPNRRIASIGAESAYFAEGESLGHRTREVSTLRKDWMQHEWGQPGTEADVTSFYYRAAGNLNGDASFSNIVSSTDPYGRSCSVWRNTGDQNNSSGGWNVQFPVNAQRSYMSILYVRRTGSASGGRFYHGCDNGNTKNLDGTDNINPYFTGGFYLTNLPQDVWCVSIGFIHHYDATTSDSTGVSGIYRLDTMQRIKTNDEFKHRYDYSSTTERYQTHRAFLFYNTTSGTQLDFWNPGFFEHQTTFPETSLLKMLTNSLVATNGYIHDKLGIGVSSPSHDLHVSGSAKIGFMTTISGGFSVSGSTTHNTLIPLIGGSGGGTIVLYISRNTNTGDFTGSAIVHFRMINSGTWTDSATRKNVISELNMSGLPTFSDNGSGYLRMTTSVSGNYEYSAHIQDAHL
jgi:hypothetical protein